MKWAASLLVVAALTVTYVDGQSPQAPVKSTASGVLIDVTVADKNGQPVLDLAPDDFELKEEGKRQQLVSLTLVHRGTTRPLTHSASAEKAEPGQPRQASPADTLTLENTPTVTAILFDRLSPDAMPYGVRGALAYVSTLTPPQDYAGIFLADLNLKTLQPFTNEHERLRGGIQRLGETAPANLRPEKQRAGDLFIQKLDPTIPITAGAEERGGSFASLAERENFLKAMQQNDYPQYRMTMIMLRMESGYRQLLAENEGQTSMAGLRSVVDGLALLPGRKTILYFTENLPITDRLKPKFEAIIGQANRANITFYPVDAAGLRLHSKEAELSRDVNLAGSQGIGDSQREDGPWTKELERQDQLLVSRPTAVLGRLAKETGGFLIENTNDLSAGVARMQQERTTYYLLGYQPTNATMDGKFRRVSVKVKRSKVSVKARPGYLAVPPPTQ